VPIDPGCLYSPGDLVAGESHVAPHGQVFVTPAGAVVPIGKYALGGPVVAYQVLESDRLKLCERCTLRGGDVGLADIGLRIEDIGVGRRDVHVTADDGGLRTSSDHLA